MEALHPETGLMGSMAHTNMSGVVRVRTSRYGGATGQDRTGQARPRFRSGWPWEERDPSCAVRVQVSVFFSSASLLPRPTEGGRWPVLCYSCGFACLRGSITGEGGRDTGETRETDVHAGWTAYLLVVGRYSMRTCMCGRAAA